MFGGALRLSVQKCTGLDPRRYFEAVTNDMHGGGAPASSSMHTLICCRSQNRSENARTGSVDTLSFYRLRLGRPGFGRSTDVVVTSRRWFAAARHLRAATPLSGSVKGPCDAQPAAHVAVIPVNLLSTGL
jgi:hypothetical protein